jgi:hypothetical protein
MSSSVVNAILNVHSGVPWPKDIVDLEYDGCLVKLVPPKRRSPDHLFDTYPIAVGQGSNRAEATVNIAVVRRFLNALAWREQSYVREVSIEVTSLAIARAVQGLGNAIVDHFDATGLAVPASREARLALAFYREGLSLQHTAYQFLSFFKVFNILNASGKPQIAWLNAHLGGVVGEAACRQRDDLVDRESDVGNYLYTSGRCAVAHAFTTPLVDPDNVEDQHRLSHDLPLIRELAALYMQKELAIPAPRGAV